MDKSGSMRKKTIAGLHKAEVMIAGEQLRLKLHDGKLIKDRRYHFRTYPNCFVAQELIDWLLCRREAPDRGTALSLMQHLMGHDIVHHVCDKTAVFKDEKLLYRFRKDDGTFHFNTEVKVFMRGQQLYEHVLQLREEQGVAYQRSFPGCQLIDWMLQVGEAESRRHGLELCCALQEHGIIQHVLKKHTFTDSKLLYQFCINFWRRRRLSELLNESEREIEEGFTAETAEDHQADSPFVLPQNLPQEASTGFQSVHLNEDLKRSLSSLRLHCTGYSSPVPLSSATLVACNPKSVLKRNVSCKELLTPGAPFVRKVLTVVGDAVGWGFVVRGNAPCHIQAVDRGSPAAEAGVKVCQFVCQVNGQSVLYLDYRTVRKLVMTGPCAVVLEVMEPQE